MLMMHRRCLLASALAATLVTPLALPVMGAPHSTLTAYANEAELRQALERWQAEALRQQRESRRDMAKGALEMNAAPATAAPQAAAKSADSSGVKSEAVAESITNVQTAGVDEGGIVKRAGDFLLILRRGRLFTVRVGGDTLAPIAAVDAYAPGASPAGAWYDELLVSGSTVVVIGYSYARGGTEIGLFEMERDGGLHYRATYHLRSFDYYSSRNYASRLIGRKLVFYTPTYLSPHQAQPWTQFPAFRHWHGEADTSGFKRILPATRIYRTDDQFQPGETLALHTVTSCDLGAADLACESTAVLGPPGRVFYVSQGSVYVWTSAWQRGHADAGVRNQPRSLSAVFRLPLDGSAPTALKTAGVPIDQMSFLESEGHLNVLLREAGRGEGMWGSERSNGAMALLRVPLSQFNDGRNAAGREHYRSLPAVAGGQLQNRFVGDWLLWGGAVGGRSLANAWALRYGASDEPQALSPGHGVERIEALGRDAVLVGNAGADLHFSAVQLRRRNAQLAGRHVQARAAQGETRSHGFFYRAIGEDDGLLGLPVLKAGGGARHGVHSGAQGAASVVYLRNRALQFAALGSLDASDARRSGDDACKASCVDWYGNARPIFLGDRVFALLGYELVEGQLTPQGGGWRWGESGEAQREDERIVERRRISFAPMSAWREGRHWPFN